MALESMNGDLASGDAVELFKDRENEYLAWVQSHPDGFVANMDVAERFPTYPMIHRASHGMVSSLKIGNFTTGDYVKYCSVDLAALQRHLQALYGRQATHCAHCM